MIFGLNFNRTPIPDGYAKRFRKSLIVTDTAGGRRKVYLQGVCTSTEERDRMLTQADNGRRLLHVEVRRTAGADAYGIYCS